MHLTETRALRAKLPAKGQTFIWDSHVRGFGVRITPGHRSYVVQVPFAGRKIRITLGDVSTLSFEGPPDKPGARDLAVKALDAARRGHDPREAILVASSKSIILADIWAKYEAAGFPKSGSTARKRLTTITADKNRWKNHFAATIAREPVENLTAARVIRWLDERPSDDIRTLSFALLKAILAFGESRGLCKPHLIKIKTKPSRKVQNFLKAEELARLDQALVILACEQPTRLLGFSCLRVLLLTGARSSEIKSLKWSMIDFSDKVLRIEHHKGDDNGKTILLNDAACETLASIPRTSSPFVFPSTSRIGHLTDLRPYWLTVTERAQVPRVRVHDLRHSFASAVLNAGHSLATVGGLLGHAPGSRQTARYAHLLTETKRQALDAIRKAIAEPTT